MRNLKRAAGLALMVAVAAAGLAAIQGGAGGQVAGEVRAPLVGSAAGVLFSKPGRIRYDDKSMIIDGKPVFIYSGALHYFRCPKELWKDRFARMKEAGLNCVETYLAWNYHEAEEPAGVGDFSKLKHMDDLNDFIQMARDMGMYVIIRPGPYICAEWDRGGLPEWLLKGMPEDFKLSHDGGGYLRSSNPAVLAWDKHWLEAAAKVVKPHLVTNLPAGQPGVILWQLENEYNLCEIPAAEQGAVLRALAEDSLAAGIDVPLFACRTRTANYDAYLQARLFDSVTCYPKYDMSLLVARIGNIAEPQPGKFKAVMELQGGWFSENSGKLSAEMGFSAAQLNQLGVVALEQGCTLINWYMFYGGTQLGYGAAQGMTQSYDYDAPIREWGSVGPRYVAAKALGLMLKEHGERLARSREVPVKVSGVPSDVHVSVRQAEDGSWYFFVRTDSQNEGRKGTAEVEIRDITTMVSYDLPAFGAKILYVKAGSQVGQGEWLPKAAEGPKRPNSVKSFTLGMKPTGVLAEEFVNWRGVKAGETYASMGIPDSRYAEFRGTLTLTEEEAKNPPMLAGRAEGLRLIFAINGKVAAGEESGVVDLKGKVKAGDNKVEVLAENIGNANHDNLDVQKRVPELSLVAAGDVRELADWRMKSMGAVVTLAGTQLGVAADLNVLDWPRVSLKNGVNMLGEGSTGVFATSVDVTPAQLAAGEILMLGTVDETADVFVNGVRAGWNFTERCIPLTVDITKSLKVGRNVIAVAVANKDHAGGLYGGAWLMPRGKAVGGLEMAMETKGVKEKVWEDNAAMWERENAGVAPAGLMNWYRMDFVMDAAPVGVWMPYSLHLEAEVNGEIYLNGHHLGRYWSAGPQREVWLPECWLNMGGKNVVAVQGRVTGSGKEVFKVAEVKGMGEAAEVR